MIFSLCIAYQSKCTLHEGSKVVFNNIMSGEIEVKKTEDYVFYLQINTAMGNIQVIIEGLCEIIVQKN